MLSDEMINRLGQTLAGKYDDINRDVLRIIAKRLRTIGTINSADAAALARMRDIGGDVNKITYALARLTEISVADISDIFAEVAAGNLLFSKRFYSAQNAPFIPYRQNIAMQRIVAAQSAITAGNMVNLSRSTVMLGATDRHSLFMPISAAYQSIVDSAIRAAQSGLSSYTAELQKIVRRMAYSGVNVVQYSSGAKRRIDSAMRMNLVDGIRAVNEAVDAQIAQEIGADGVELSAHTTCAPDHLPMQGRQFSNEQFVNLQNAMASIDVNGHQYDPVKRAIGVWNCRHYAFPIVIDVSKPVHSDADLAEIKRRNEEKLTIDGKEYTPYEASQIMRQIETAIRTAKNEAAMYDELGDKAAEAAARKKATDLTVKYKAIADAAGMRMKPARIRGAR